MARRTWDGKFSLTLQECGVGGDELVGLRFCQHVVESARVGGVRTATSLTLTPGMLAVDVMAVGIANCYCIVLLHEN